MVCLSHVVLCKYFHRGVAWTGVCDDGRENHTPYCLSLWVTNREIGVPNYCLHKNTSPEGRKVQSACHHNTKCHIILGWMMMSCA